MATRDQKLQNSNKSQKRARPYIPRKTYKFQLRRDTEIESQVINVLDQAKSQRRQVTVIREAVALWAALESGNLEYLFEKFPQYRAQLQPDTHNLIEQFRQMLQQNAAAAPAPRALGQGTNTLELPPPTFDDDDDLVIKHDSQASSTAMLNTVFSFL